MPLSVLVIISAFVLTAMLTPLVRFGARRQGIVARPKDDRWHAKPTALMGGIAIFLAMAVVWIWIGERNGPSIVMMIGSAMMFALGFIDDLWHLKPYQKLIGQIMAAAIVTAGGWMLPWTPLLPVNILLTIFWLVGITNAVNLLDNMDGLAAGVSAISAGFLASLFAMNGQSNEAVLLAAFAAALVGFLIYNWNPASIFMGDCGSLFIGFFLAATSLASFSGGRLRTLVPVLGVPVLIFVIPIFDTTLVTLARKLAGRAVSQGGRDHTSHRLVAMGLSERRAVLMLYGLAFASGLLAMAVCHFEYDVCLMILGASVVFLTYLGIHLGGVAVYDPDSVNAARARPFAAFLIDISYKRRLFEALLDLMLIVVSYYAATLLIFGRLSEPSMQQTFLYAVAVMVFIKLPTFLIMGLYRGLWRYFGMHDLVSYARAVVVGSAASALTLLLMFRFEGYSRFVFLLDAAILLLLLVGSRAMFRLFRHFLRAGAATTESSRRVLIYGAGDSGELALRELRNNPALQCCLVGFVDDDPLKHGKAIHGLPVFSGNGHLPEILRDQRIDEVVVAGERFGNERLRQIAEYCNLQQVVVKRLRIFVEPLNSDE